MAQTVGLPQELLERASAYAAPEPLRTDLRLAVARAESSPEMRALHRRLRELLDSLPGKPEQEQRQIVAEIERVVAQITAG